MPKTDAGPRAGPACDGRPARAASDYSTARMTGGGKQEIPMIDDPLERSPQAFRDAVDAALADEARELVAAERAAAPVAIWNGLRNVPRRVRPYFATIHRLRWAWRRLVQRRRRTAANHANHANPGPIQP